MELRPYKHSDDIYLRYKLSDDQASFTSSWDQCFEEGVFSDRNKSVVVIVERYIPVGFFVLDGGEGKLKLSDDPNTMLLRSFSISPLYQSRGLGLKAMLLLTNFLQQYFPEVREVILSVNQRNMKVYQLYVNAGFTDTNRLIEGPKGLQHVLSKHIPVI